MPNWRDLRHAYGSAEDLPEILEQLEPDTKAPVWGELWGRVCHQGTIYSASMPVLPFLLDAASGWGPLQRAMPLALAGSIVAAPGAQIAGYESCVESLRLLALETLKARGLSRYDRVYVTEAVLALSGDPIWGRVLDQFNDGAFPGRCHSCRAQLEFVIGEYGFFCAGGDWVRDADTPRTEIHPCERQRLNGLGEWLCGISADSGDMVLADRVRYLFGNSRCPRCGQPVEVARAVEDFEMRG
jgi:hypothetical protein